MLFGRTDNGRFTPSPNVFIKLHFLILLFKLERIELKRLAGLIIHCPIRKLCILVLALVVSSWPRNVRLCQVRLQEASCFATIVQAFPFSPLLHCVLCHFTSLQAALPPFLPFTYPSPPLPLPQGILIFRLKTRGRSGRRDLARNYHYRVTRDRREGNIGLIQGNKPTLHSTVQAATLSNRTIYREMLINTYALQYLTLAINIYTRNQREKEAARTIRETLY